jgi:uncharacterized damage-inducible protein DinB
MAERAEALASQFEKANQDVIDLVGGLSDDQWNATCEDEGWSVGVTAHHIAAGYPLLTGLIQGLASGADIPVLTWDVVDQGNAGHAQQFANTTKDETVQALRDGGAAAATSVRSLTDEQLDKTRELFAGDPEISIEGVITDMLIGSAIEHVGSIKKAI